MDVTVQEEHTVGEHAELHRRKRGLDTDVSADDEDEADEHLQVEQDLLGAEPTSSAPHVPETPEHADVPPSSSQPATTYKSRARRRTERERSTSAGAAASRSSSPRTAPSSDTESVASTRDEAVTDAERDKTRRRTTQVLLMLHNQVSNHTHGNLFHQAIKEMVGPPSYPGRA